MAGSEDGTPEIISGDVAALVDTGGFNYSIYLIVRGEDAPTEPNKLAFPGGRKDDALDGGKVRKTAKRELKEEANIDAEEEDLKPFHVLDGPGRDPRPGPPRTSVVFVTELLPHQHRDARAGDGAAELRLIPLAEVPLDQMAFDHAEAIVALQRKYC